MDNENSSIFQPYQQYECWRGSKQFILKNSIGRQLPYIVNFSNNTCQIYDIEWERITHSFEFPEGCRLIDVDYFPTKEGQFGVLVGVEDPRQSWGAEHFVVALATVPDRPAMKITHSVEVSTKINVVKTLFSASDMSEGVHKNVLKLFHKLMEWHHVVAIGCKECHCHLAQLTPTETSSEMPITIAYEPKNQIDIMNAFVDEYVLRYNLADGSFRDYPSSAVYVSALSLMPRSRTLLIGLSMGGIISASLNSSNQMTMLELRHERLIRKIASLEPEDDPDKFEYFVAAVDSSPRHPIMIQLWRGSFKSLEEVEEDEIYDRPYYNVCLEHKILFGEKWISLNTIVNEREHLMTTRKRSAEESQLNVSQTFGATANRSSVLLSYKRKKIVLPGEDPNAEPVYIVEGAIFDIDAWYYKRVPGRVSTDGTILKQCAFLSTIKTDVPSRGVNDIGILTLNATDVTRFSSMISDADQLFYPSALSYERAYFAKNTGIEWMKIQNVQDTIISKCAAKLPLYIQSPEMMSGVIMAAGLVRKNILSGSPNSSAAEINYTQLTSDQKVVLNLIVYYGKIEEFSKLARNPQINDTLKNEIAEWAIHEAVDYKRTISDKMVALFQGRSNDLSPLAEDSFIQGIKLFRVVYEYLKTCSKTLKSSRLHNFAHSVKCMQNHTKLTYQFIKYGIIPVNQERQQTMKDMHSRKMMEAIKFSSSLPIQSVIRSMERLAPNAQFWDGVPHSEWYPPTPVDLLESLLNVSISERIKRELVVQYTLDWIRSAPEVPNYTERQLAIEVIKVMTNQMLEVDLEKIYYVMDGEKKALSDNKASEEVKALGEKVFSMQNEKLTYDKLWGDSFPMGMTISEDDMERFARRMKMHMEGGASKLPLLDLETEMLYQVFLYEKRRFDLMSPEAVQSNDLLAMFMPGITKKKPVTIPQKTAKEKEIEESVRSMFDKNRQREQEKMSHLFMTVDEMNERKRKSSRFEDDNSNSSVCSFSFVPPTAKKIQQGKKSADTTVVLSSPVLNYSIASITSQISSDDPHQNNEINNLIATPARYYKRPNNLDVDTDLLSPSADKAPPATAQNSILKTNKGVQSASRGRIRFHESVPHGADESAEAPKGLKLNFAILEDDEEEETMTARKSRTIEVQEEVTSECQDEEEEVIPEDDGGQDRCIEYEKSFENQEDYEVLQENSPTGSKLEKDVEPLGKDEPDDVVTENVVDKEDVDALSEELSDGVMRSSEIQSEDDCDSIEIDKLEKEEIEEKKTENFEEEQGSTETEKITEIKEDIFESLKPEETGKMTEKKLKEHENNQTEQNQRETMQSSFEMQEEEEEEEEEEEKEHVAKETQIVEKKLPPKSTRSSSVPKTPATRPRTRSSSTIKETENTVESAEPASSNPKRSTSCSSSRAPASVEATRRTCRSESVPRKTVSRATSVEIEKSDDQVSTPKRGRPRKIFSTTPSTESRKRDSSETPGTPAKRQRKSSRLTPLKSIPEAEDEPSTSNSMHSDTNSQFELTPRRGRGRPRKSTLANVEEEKDNDDNNDDEPLNETSLRRSSRFSQTK